MSKKKNKVYASGDRFFFTATPELTKWIIDESKKCGLNPPEFIRMKLHTIAEK